MDNGENGLSCSNTTEDGHLVGVENMVIMKLESVSWQYGVVLVTPWYASMPRL